MTVMASAGINWSFQYDAGVEAAGHDSEMKYATLALWGCLNEWCMVASHSRLSATGARCAQRCPVELGVPMDPVVAA